jgi:hypothetical protein
LLNNTAKVNNDLIISNTLIKKDIKKAANNAPHVNRFLMPTRKSQRKKAAAAVRTVSQNKIHLALSL